MSVWVGSLPRLVELKCPSAQTQTEDDRYTFDTTLEGVRKAQVRKVGRREWSLTVSAARPEQVANIMSFVRGVWGPGPFVFVPADAPVTNLLTPAQASCDPTEYPGPAGSATRPPMLTPEGWEGRSVLNADPAQLLWFGTGHVPVRAGVRVTGSAYVQGADAAVQLYFYDAAGERISLSTSTVRGTAGSVVRSHLTVLPPAGAVSCLIACVRTAKATRPQVTWSDYVLPWSEGRGCVKAVVHGPSHDLVMATSAREGGRYAQVSFTVTEVG